MASAPVIPFSTQTYRQPARPAVRIAFIAGEAEQAVSAATADLPAAVKSATLDDLNVGAAVTEIGEQTHAFIELARGLLSPAMFPTFLRWGATAAHLATTCEDDDESDRRFDAAGVELKAVHAVTSGSPHDFTFKTHLIELYDHPQAGELGPIGEDGVCLHSADPTPLLEALDALAVRAFALSRALNLSEPIGDTIRRTFLDAGVCEDGASFRELMIQRNVIVEHLNGSHSWSDAEGATGCRQINEIESVILKRPAATADDAVMKLIAVAQVAAGGHEIDDAEAADAILEARRFFGIGYVHEHLQRPVAPASIVLPEGYDPYMRGPFIAWQRRYEDHASARSERLTFEDAIYSPAGSDVDDAMQAKYDDLVDAEGEALNRLLLCVAPGPAELAVKLKLLADGEQWRLNQREGIVEAITADARRFGRHGTHLQGDNALLVSFSALRSVWAERGRAVDTDEAEDEAFYADLDRHEGIIAANEARTLEGVLAKLRVAFLHMVGEDWSDLTLVDPNARDFLDGIASADPFQKLLWSATTDLARIAGVSLSEQGR